MRARYTAYVLAKHDFISDSWHPGTRPDDVTTELGLRWEGLDIIDAPEAGEKRGFVEFRAHWRVGAETGTLSERSRFVRQSGRWWYLDGVVS